MPFVNRTRQSKSIPQKLWVEGRGHLVPLYYLLRLSFLGLEGIEQSGSAEFADHIYDGRSKGRFIIGRYLDQLLLSLPSARSFRNRYFHSRNSIISALLVERPYRIASVPCGLPRDLLDVAKYLREHSPELLPKVSFYGIDLDSNILEKAREMVRQEGFNNFTFIQGDALDRAAYPENLDIITSAGFTEFLSDKAFRSFLDHCSAALSPRGIMVTSSTVRHALSDYLLRHIAELHTHYREEGDIKALFSRTPLEIVDMTRDAVGYQVLIQAQRNISPQQ